MCTSHDKVKSQDKDIIKELFLEYAVAHREDKELRKPMVRAYILVKSVQGMETYLSLLIGAHD